MGPKGAAEKLLDPQGPLGTAVESALRCLSPTFPTLTPSSIPSATPTAKLISLIIGLNNFVLPVQEESEI